MANLKLAIAGLGAIGLAVARRVDKGDLPGFTLTAVAARDADKARHNLADFRSPPKIVALAALASHADVVLECIPGHLFAEVAEPTLKAGRIFMPLSVGQMLTNMHLVDIARQTGGRIIVPSGALLGLDAVRAVAEGNVSSVTISTRKPPAGLKGAPHLVANDRTSDAPRQQ